ncbi:hypothetical protein KC19_12G091200 [Ceratodon purpureus]|uniref:PGG domain-containing protein n=1 Tax=Ceratodon purpureus TaxID=3225 RepID=A0A8T0G677_CERPU|nr:hypothetical protein KC19_12G091200 [Ceratodon purpureus]
MSEKDPTDQDALGVQCDAPPELPIPPAPDQGVHGAADNIFGLPEENRAACDHNLGDSTCDGDVRLPTASSHGSEQSSQEEISTKPVEDGLCEGIQLAALDDQDTLASREAKYLWKAAIGSKNVAELLKLLRENPMNLTNLERNGRKRGRTALHIAAECDNPDNLELANLILDQLLEFRQKSYTEEVFQGRFSWDRKKEFRTVGDYLRAVEKSSKKTAIELAKEGDPTENRMAICEKIIDTQNLTEAHVKIDRAVALRDMLKCDVEMLRNEAEEWLHKVIMIRDCTLLKKFLDRGRFLGLSALRMFNIWKCKDDSGRTMLHIAAMQGSFLLAKQLLDLARIWEDRGYIECIDPESGLTAFQMANDIIGNRSIAEYMKSTLELMKDELFLHPSFFEAYPRTLWCTGLALGWCDLLLDLLERNNHRLLLETYNGLTVLHVAIICKNHELVDEILEIFGAEKEISFGDSYYPSELTWKKMFQQKCCVHEHMFDVVVPQILQGNEHKKYRDSITAFKAIMEKRPRFIGSAMELIDYFIQIGNDDAFYNDVAIKMKAYDEKEAVVGDSDILHLIEDSEPFSSMKDLIKENWTVEWDKGYWVDVDFNFEVGPRFTLLKVHYACKHPLKFKKFLQSICSSKLFKSVYRYLHDAQGRTIFHIVLDHCNNQVRFPGRWILTEIFDDIEEFHKLAQDARGRTLNDILLVKNYLQNNISLQSIGVSYDFDYMKSCADAPLFDDNNDNNVIKTTDAESLGLFHYIPMNKDDYAIVFMHYYLATILKQTRVAQHILSIFLEKDPDQLKMKLFDFKAMPFIASSIGHQVTLLLLMEAKVDLTIPDASVRTVLHHAADPTLLEFADLLECPMVQYCFSTVMDLCGVQNKWNAEKMKTARIFPSRDSEKQSAVEKLESPIIMERKACISLLLQAGVDLSQEDMFRKAPTIAPNYDPNYQRWWYDMVLKDATEKKKSFNDAASALSVVAALVAATSYIGPLQPPMNYTQPDGLVHTSVKLVRMFMVTNSLAFYLAMTSVILAVVPSLPMPRESVLSEVKRAQHIVSFSLYLLLMAIVCIILSFAAASMVVMQDQYSFPGSDLLFFPTFLGCFLCFIAIVSFLIRVMKLTFYDSPVVRKIYEFSFTKFCEDVIQSCYAPLSSAKSAFQRPDLKKSSLSGKQVIFGRKDSSFSSGAWDY